MTNRIKINVNLAKEFSYFSWGLYNLRNMIKLTKPELIDKLKSQGAFWSYQIDNPEEVPDSILIEQTLRWGDVPEILALFDMFPSQKIKSVWEMTMLPDKRIYPHNYYLARIFFKIDEPKKYILSLQKQNSRHERLKKLTS